MARISYNGFTNEYATLKNAETIQTGKGISVDEDGCAINSNDGEVLIGFCINSRDGFVTVQFRGYFEVKYTGTTPSYGAVKLVNDSAGGVRVADSDEDAEYSKVLKVDEDNKIVGFIFN